MTRIGMVRYYSRTFMVAFAMLCSVSCFGRAAAAADYNVYLAVQDFTWKEFDDDGSRLVKESGPLFGLGFTYWNEFQNHVTVKPTAELFGGSVDYDGHTQSGVPATTTVNYFGLKLEGEVGRRFRPEQSFFLEPFGGLGFRFWLRDIKDGTTLNGSPTFGYTEDWITLHARLGLRAGMDFSSRKQLFAWGGVKIPLYNENTAYLSDLGGSDLTFNPGKKASFFVETGVRINRFEGSLFYDSLRFSKSNVIVTSNGVNLFLNWQPKSTMDIYGVKLGIVF